MLVMKFGGTSVRDAEAIERVAGIVRSRMRRRPVVVVSAFHGVTDQLLKVHVLPRNRALIRIWQMSNLLDQDFVPDDPEVPKRVERDAVQEVDQSTTARRGATVERTSNSVLRMTFQAPAGTRSSRCRW